MAERRRGKQHKEVVSDVTVAGIYSSKTGDGGVVIGVEHVFHEDGGCTHVLDVFSDSLSGIEDVTRQFQDVHDDVGQDSNSQGSGRSTFGFSSDRWSSPWQPTGPKPINRQRRDLENDLDVS